MVRHPHAKTNLEREPRHRNRSVWAHALVLFNVIGIPLSHGVYLEYYFTTALPDKPLSSLAVIIGLQILCIFVMPLPIGCLYQSLGRREWWKAVFALAALVAVAAQVALYRNKTYMLIVLLQGPLLGAALGTLFTISTLVLASHYQYNIPLVSTQSGFAAFAGAVVHTALARFALQQYAAFSQVFNGALIALTLLPAFFLLTRLKLDTLKPWTLRYQLNLKLPSHFMADLRSKGTIWFIIGYILVFFSIFIYPMYIITLLTQPPALMAPEMGTYTLLATLGTAAFSSAICGNSAVMKRVGPVNTFVASAIFAGAVTLSPILYPRIYVSVPLAAAYGVALGPILSLHQLVAAIFLGQKEEGGKWRDDVPARVAIVMAMGGIGAFSGIVVLAAVAEGSAKGVDLVVRLAGACAVSGGGGVGMVRWFRWEGVGFAV
ncbi:hypothetical protein EJ02DRAFT_406827 [Clathrospora elynae]|uniref:MFS general substrate transporter n=1 Tax=Clathrospora elynae TaxID=706981 RepID=A0A6A5SL15_9PLEO|nr:hypothetical protein EJ02DRAFT_406827 [Clathrospora elynae]